MRLQKLNSDRELAWDAVAETIATEGVVLINGASVNDVRDLLSGWTTPVAHPHESDTGLTIITPRCSHAGTDGRAGFGRSGLVPHTDRSLIHDPPSLLATVVIAPSSSGGETLLVDGKHIVEALEHSFGPAAVASLRLQSWDGRSTPAVQRTAGLARIRFRCDQIASLYSETGDREIVDAWHELTSRPTVLSLATGDGYLVHNHRFLHGRSEFTGSRRLERLLAKVSGRSTWAWLNSGFRLA